MNRTLLALPLTLLTLLTPALHSAEPARVLIVVGPTDHPPGTHEVAAGGRVLKHSLENMANVPGVTADLVSEWPKDKTLLTNVRSVIFIGDTFPPQRMPGTKEILADLDTMMNRGVGIACVHYATGLRGEDVAPDGDHPLLRWLGGYFANRTCPHHESFARIYPQATIEPAVPRHPISRGWKTFTLHDEPYFNNYFGKSGNQPASNVTVLATSMLPPDAPKREPVAWCVERTDGGRGFGIVMPHFYKNWANDDLRRFVLNGVIWTTKLDVPAEGVTTILPDLKTFSPVAMEFLPKPKAPAKKDGVQK